MEISLVIPPSPFLIDDRVFPFLGPLQIAATARCVGHNVRVIDLSGFNLRHPDEHSPSVDRVVDEACEVVERSVLNSDLIGFYSLATQHPIVVKLMHRVKLSSPKSVTVLGGPHANTSPMNCVKDGFNHIVVSDQGGGGGEDGFMSVLESIENGLNPSKIVSVTSRRGVKWENDRWPFPARDLIDLKTYKYTIEGERATSIVTMSGCPFACSYCSHWCGYRKIEGKSSNYVSREIDHIKTKYDMRAIMFYDDEINLRPDFQTEFLPMLRSSGIIWRAFFKGGKNLTNERVFEEMSSAGCVQLCTGAESADENILKKINKKTSVDDNTNFVKYCVKNSIKPKVFTQVGLPGETNESIKKLRNWLVSMVDEGLSDADVSITTPFEGTPIYENPDEYEIHFNKSSLDYSREAIGYKTSPNEYKSHVWHDSLSQSDIVSARQWIEDEFRSAAGLGRLVKKQEG